MSLTQISLGIFLGGCALTTSLFLGSYFAVNPLLLLLACGIAVSVLFTIRLEKRSRLALQRYWDRKCTGRLWRRRFPQSSSAAIRQFLSLFVTAFAFPNRQFRFAPEDKVLDVYRALYPDYNMPDGCELEILARLLTEQYAIDITAFWREDITLGVLYGKATALYPLLRNHSN